MRIGEVRWGQRLHNHYRKTKECMTHAFTKMKRKHEVAIYENKRARGRHKGKGYTITTKGNHPDEAYVRRGWRKRWYRRERDSFEGPHEEEEIQRKVLRRGKNSAFSEESILEKEKVRSKVTPRKVGVRLRLVRTQGFRNRVFLISLLVMSGEHCLFWVLPWNDDLTSRNQKE